MVARRHLSADAVSAIAGPALVVEATVRPRNGGTATALGVGIGRCESREGDWWFGWWLANCVVERQVLGILYQQNLQARAATIVKNLAILIKFLVVLGELSRLERIVVRCESEATDAGGFQDSHESSTEAYYIDLETPMFAGAHTTLDT
ncbi:hypothetical protein IAQ61_001555 [Plenodomus lingam]|uniref:uncharacterized protein n=1 Tax=Leptosphaeria maculans TaxID=5022 RepID=UPI003331BF37|nr:hypothetical protein IAQ61_001555 [Plenodomus lingam]